MAITDRPLFGNTPVDSKGTGITSGLDTEDNRLNQLFEQQQNILQSIRPPTQEFNRFQAASPALLTLGANLLSGRSFQGGFGGALDIAGQALGAATPQFSQALEASRKAKAAERSEEFQLDLQAYSQASDMLAAENLATSKAAASAPTFDHKGTFNEVFTYPSDPNAEGYVEGKAGLKVNRIVAINARETTTGTQYGDEVILSEEPFIDNTPPTGIAKNIVFDGGLKDGETTAAIAFNDGRVVYFDPTNDNADENGFVNVKTYDGNFTLFSSATSDTKADFLTERDISTITKSIGTFSETIAQGGSLLQQGLNLGNNLNTLNRYILDTGGQLLGQFSPQAKQALFDWFDENPDDLTKFILDARTYAAKMIAPFTGEESSRISEPERELTNQTVRLFDGIIDAPTAIAAIEASIALTYVGQHRNFYTLPDAKYQYAVNLPEEDGGIQGWNLDPDAVAYHEEKLRRLGLSENLIRDTILKMQIMETAGLEDLRIITQGFNNRSTDSVINTEAGLIGG
tara:strand:- start:64 stop:1608 length:1545 start_codon:yes stop_codon:yes gene_type:complete